MNTFKDIGKGRDMPKEMIEIDTTKDQESRRAKRTKVKINSKNVEFPLKATNISTDNQQEFIIAQKELDRTTVNQLTLQITPKRLLEIATNSKIHQGIKDDIRKSLSGIGKRGYNVIYPLLINQRSPHEPLNDFRPFRRPTEQVVTKFFDLFDIEEIDMLVTPVALDDTYEMEWAKISADIFSNRNPDYLNEYVLSGLIPNGVSEGTAKKMASLYLNNSFESLTFDFAKQRVREGRMREIIDGISQHWDELLIHGANVPHYNWYGTYRNRGMPTYDLLVSVYGFDSFSGLTTGFNVEVEGKDRIAKKMRGKRYRFIDTYGTYNKEGLETILQTHSASCKCPTCNRVGSPLDLYDKKPNQANERSLGAELKTHRLHVTHKEMKSAADLIVKGNYHDHLLKKKESTNELQSIISAIEQR